MTPLYSVPQLGIEETEFLTYSVEDARDEWFLVHREGIAATILSIQEVGVTAS